MFSYLRSNNRRSPLPPAPTPYTAATRHVHSLHGSTEDVPSKHPYRLHDQLNPSPISSNPPILPPISRVTSQHESSKGREDGSQAGQRRFDLFGNESWGGNEAPQLPQEEPLPTRCVEDKSHFTKPAEELSSPPTRSLPFTNRQLRPPHTTTDALRSYSEPAPEHARTKTQEQAPASAEAPSVALPPPTPKLSSSPASTAAGRQGKMRFNLRNPMSLLAKRRSPQAVAEANDEKAQYRGVYPPVPNLPQDFDPRIRGKVVHDFSAPRPRTNKSSNSMRDSDRCQREAILYNSRRASPNPSTAYVDDDSPSSGEREHTPQFKEHFDDDFGPAKDGPAKKRTSAFMYQVSLSESQPKPDPSILPPFARHLPSNLTASVPVIPKALPSPPKKSLKIVPETSSMDAATTDKPAPSTPPKSPLAKARSRASSNTDSPFQPAGLPKHFKSNASRFSFDLAGKGSAAQEKLLEEKHRENERKKARRSNVFQAPEADMVDDDDGYSDGFNDLDDDDSLEERIPGVNADAEDLDMLDAQQHSQDLDFVSPNESSLTSAPSLASTGLISPNIVGDNVGLERNVALYYAPSMNSLKDSDKLDDSPTTVMGSAEGQDDYVTNYSPLKDSGPGVDPPNLSLSEDEDDDDLYFDDGMIDDFELPDEPAFDESVFDDDTSRMYRLPLRDQNPSKPEVAAAFQQKCSSVAGDQSSYSFARAETVPQFNPVTRASVSHNVRIADLADYHDALAVKVNQAAKNGEFARRSSMEPLAEGPLENNDGQSQTHLSWSGFAGRKAGGLCIGDGVDDVDSFDVNDALADDPIIAAANAEALENDDEGFYGQEFGFFARASGAEEAEYANGGYFGSRGFEGIGRSHSGRVNEPSLTPITERSEWSNRNSAISLAMHGFQPSSAGPCPSPGLAQLADMMPPEGDDISLSALMKLRRGTWGGSNASLQSSSSGSPLTYVSGIGFPAAIPMQHSNSSNGNLSTANGSPLIMDNAHAVASSPYSSNGFSSSNDSSPASATITLSNQQQAYPVQHTHQNTPTFLSQQLQPQSAPVPSLPSVNVSRQPKRRSLSPVKRSSMGPPPKPGKAHSRNSSNTSESVSYMHEIEGGEGGRGRWVLEKRRVDESGVVEVLEREIVEGGRI
ncbi:MAG: hypothetical protein LQ346_000726 [Caloplaca aetnensis]|nr:MAG: hypothetical protein LQ346_000726 [Caloplaca aetnensis]